MRQIIGWFIVLCGFFMLGLYINNYLSKKTANVSPIPNNDNVKVIMLTTTP